MFNINYNIIKTPQWTRNFSSPQNLQAIGNQNKMNVPFALSLSLFLSLLLTHTHTPFSSLSLILVFLRHLHLYYFQSVFLHFPVGKITATFIVWISSWLLFVDIWRVEISDMSQDEPGGKEVVGSRSQNNHSPTSYFKYLK